MNRVTRSGQTTVETLLLISVIVVAIVAASWVLTGDPGGEGITNAMSEFGAGAATVYSDPASAPN
jgi:Trk-type K+ transport system membrane component